jgi:hypothetical protein
MNDCNANAKKSLMNSLQQLNYRAEQLTDLAKSSGYLVKKFINPNPEVDCGEINGMKQNSEPLPSQPDLIDLFDRVSERMQSQIEIIGKNMEVVSQMVD